MDWLTAADAAAGSGTWRISLTEIAQGVTDHVQQPFTGTVRGLLRAILQNVAGRPVSTAERNELTPYEGQLVFNRDAASFEVWDGNTWATFLPGGPPTGPAGGDLAGNFPNPQLNPAIVGTPDGLATLDNTGKIPISQLPALVVTDIFVVNTVGDLSEDLAQPDGTLGANQGDFAIVTATNQLFILAADPNTVLANWLELSLPPSGPAGADLAGNFPNPTVAVLDSLRALNTGAGVANRVVQSDGVGGVAIGTTSIARVISVSPYGRADHLTIAAALADASGLVPPPTPSTPVLIVLGPGVYSTANPLVVPAGVTIMGASPQAAIITPATPTTAVFLLEAGAGLRNVAINGAAGAGGVGVGVTGAAGDVFLDLVSCINCRTGVAIAGVGWRVVGLNCIARLTAAVPSAAGLVVSAGAQAFMVGFATLGGGPAARLSTGVSCTGAGSLVTLVDHRATDCDQPSVTDDSAATEIRGGLYDGATTALRVGPTGSSQLDFRVLRVENSSVTDLHVESSTAFIRYLASQFRDDTAIIPAAADVVGQNLANEPTTDAGIHNRGEFVVGTYSEGADAVFGEGDDTVVPETVFSNSSGEAGVWVDNTTAAKGGAPYVLLQGTAAGNTAYFGSSFGPFPSIDVTVTVAQVTGAGTYVWEYWNGVAWVAVPVMATDAEHPHEQYADNVFTRVNHEHIRFGLTPGWAARVLNGVTGYWIRYRLLTAITSRPTLTLTKIGTNHAQFNEDGALEFVGSSEPIRRLLNTRQVQYAVVGSVPGSFNIAFSANITLNYTNNRLVDGAADSFGFVVSIPHGVDTSKPFELAITWIQDNNSATGNVQFLVTRVTARDGVVLGALPETPFSAIVAAPGVQAQMNITRIPFTAPALLPDETLVFIVTRDARLANPNDTLAGNISIVDFTLEAPFWR